MKRSEAMRSLTPMKKRKKMLRILQLAFLVEFGICYCEDLSNDSEDND